LLASACSCPNITPDDQYGQEITAAANDKIKFAKYLRDGESGIDDAMNRYYADGWADAAALPVKVMTHPLLCLYFAAAVSLPGQVDSACFNGRCEFLTVRAGMVHFAALGPPARDFPIGRYVETARHLVPASEAPIWSGHSTGGLRVVVSAVLDHENGCSALRVRFLRRDGRSLAQDKMIAVPETVRMGHLFGGKDELFGITATEEHVYNVETVIWLLSGDVTAPKEILRTEGVLRTFITHPGKQGVWIDHETYNGVDARTKGWIRQFWVWDAKRKALTLQR
jgi:hypothetical protein